MLQKSDTTTLTVTAKGQVTLRKEVLRHLGVKPGDKVRVKLEADGAIELQADRSKKQSIDQLFGLLHDPDGPKLTLDEIQTAIEEAWAGRR